MKRKILVHTCCANCLIYPLKILRDFDYEIHSFFYNHIHPFTEFKRRLDTTIEYTKKMGINLIIKEKYELIDFIQNVAFREEKRCFYCYNSRLEATAKLAAKSNFEAFTTTLLYSKHQKHDLIKDICENLENRYGVKFFYFDFRKGWNEAIEEAKKMGLYRQNYCGCIYSEKERYLGKKDRFKIEK